MHIAEIEAAGFLWECPASELAQIKGMQNARN